MSLESIILKLQRVDRDIQAHMIFDKHYNGFLTPKWRRLIRQIISEIDMQIVILNATDEEANK